MATPRSRQAARLRARRKRAQQRARAFAVLAFLSVLGVVTLLLTAFGSGTPQAAQAETRSLVPASLPTGRPRPQSVATVGNLRLQLPVAESALTAVGFHGTNGAALELTPLGRQANQGLLERLWTSIAGTEKAGPEWFQLGGGGGVGTEVLDVGAPAGTDVYAPVDGTVAAISDLVVNDRVVGARIDLRPTEAPSVIVSVANVAPDRSLAVGAPVRAAVSKLGSIVDLSKVMRQALARHTRDAGNNVAIEVHPAAGSVP